MKYLMLIFLYLALYQVWGQVFSFLFRWKEKSILWKEIIGFFGYSSVFQIVALPMILKKNKLSVLSGAWFYINIAAICFFILVFVIKIVQKKREGRQRTSPESVCSKCDVALIIVAAAAVVFLAYYAAVQPYQGWDTAYYMGTVSTTVHTDTMYQFDGNTGYPVTDLDLRYALSSFYMQTAVLAKWTGIHVLSLQFFVVKPLSALLYGLVAAAFGSFLFHGQKGKSAVFVLCAVLVNFLFVSMYTTSEFLITRGYEAKGYCADVVIPAVFLCFLLLWREHKHRVNWQILFLIAFASVPISMSALALVPAMIVVMTLAAVFAQREWRYIWKALPCIAPNLCYMALFYIHSQGILTIGV